MQGFSNSHIYSIAFLIRIVSDLIIQRKTQAHRLKMEKKYNKYCVYEWLHSLYQIFSSLRGSLWGTLHNNTEVANRGELKKFYPSMNQKAIGDFSFRIQLAFLWYTHFSWIGHEFGEKLKKREIFFSYST